MNEVYFIVASTKDVALADCRICDNVNEAKTGFTEMFDTHQMDTIRVFKMNRTDFYQNISQNYKLSSFLGDATPVNPLNLTQPTVPVV